MITLFVSAKLMTFGACNSDNVDMLTDDAGQPVDPTADLSGTSGGDMAGTSGGGDMAVGGPPEGNQLLNGITAEHNKARVSVNPVPAQPLPLMTWSATVAATAQAWANGCRFMHNPNSPYGENIFATSGTATPAAVVADWVSEKANYNYGANTCSGTCGHYTQVVWRSSVRLGCGVKNCTTGSPFGSGAWQFWVCSYDPPGNFTGQRPY